MFINPISFGMAMIPQSSLLEAMQKELRETPMKKAPSKLDEQEKLRAEIAKRNADTRDALVDIEISIREEEGHRYMKGDVILIHRGAQALMSEGENPVAITIEKEINPKKSLKKNFDDYLKKVDKLLKERKISAAQADFKLVGDNLPVPPKKASFDEVNYYLNIKA